ncbi:MAG: hypothetical protein OXI22_07130 [Defluviicoccus sp.]|nr:hypothetical protein [Defluviicoccus sp.]MDE0383637.1 hypothetical protein [Defluviicoccus sp.]
MPLVWDWSRTYSETEWFTVSWSERIFGYLPDGDEIWSRIWLLYCMYDFDTHRTGPQKIYEGRSRSTQIVAPAAD